MKRECAHNGAFHAILYKLFHQMEKLSGRDLSCIPALKTEEFNREFRGVRPQFVRNEQHDAQEFLTMLLELVHNECNQADKRVPRSEEPKSAQEAWSQHVATVDDSYLSKVLMGQVESCLTCHACGNTSLSWNCFWQLQLNLTHNTDNAKFTENKDAERHLTLKDCINEYMDAEVSGSNFKLTLIVIILFAAGAK